MTNYQPYFARPETTDLICSLAVKQRLAVFIGAGWSVDWGLPSWDGLIQRLLRDHVAPLAEIYDEESRTEFVRVLLRDHDLIQAASVVRESLEDQFDSHLRDALYHNRVGDHGPAASAIAKLYYAWAADHSRHIELITLNYDTSIEAALMHEDFASVRAGLGISEVATICTADDRETSSQSDTLVPVYHLHGVVPLDGPSRGPLVFSEEDYYSDHLDNSDGQPQRWQDELVAEALHDPDCGCLFVGMSLADPNVLRYLFRASAYRNNDRPIVFLPRQVIYDVYTNADVLRHVERATRSRLRRLGVRSESPDYFSQVPQLFRELAACVRLSDRGASSTHTTEPAVDVGPYRSNGHYSVRLQGWRELMESLPPIAGSATDRSENQVTLPGLEVDVNVLTIPRLDTSNDQNFAAMQTWHHLILRRTRTLLYYIVEDFRKVQEIRERFALQLWARNPLAAPKALEAWGSSERAWLERETLGRATISRHSEYNAVHAFCNGGCVIEPTTKAGSRWGFSISSAIYLDGIWNGLPVGVMVLESSNKEADSCLRRLTSGQRQDIAVLLRTVGQLLLDPSADLRFVRRAVDSLIENEQYEASSVVRALQTVIMDADGAQLRPRYGYKPVFDARDRARWKAIES